MSLWIGLGVGLAGLVGLVGLVATPELHVRTRDRERQREREHVGEEERVY
jgi:hypothetical protein